MNEIVRPKTDACIRGVNYSGSPPAAVVQCLLPRMALSGVFPGPVNGLAPVKMVGVVQRPARRRFADKMMATANIARGVGLLNRGPRIVAAVRYRILRMGRRCRSEEHTSEL